MTAAAVLRRIAAMEPGELRFRGACELRKVAGRARTALARPRWDRQALSGVLQRGGAGGDAWGHALKALGQHDITAAHTALAAHFTGRRSAFPLNARDIADRTRLIASRFPDATADAAARGQAILDGRYDLLGYRGLSPGRPIDWHLDPVHGRRAPVRYWADVPYLDPAAGDHKVIWELNRHQHWLALGRAFALTNERPYFCEFTAQLSGWLAANPPLVGVNWASMLELAFRTLSWLWAIEYFAGAAGPDDREPWIVDLLLALDRQLTHVEQNLSRYFSPNTHLTGEALALYVSGAALPELRASARRQALGREVLTREATRQINPDGGHAELSTHYHRYSTDFYLLALAVARAANDPAADVFEDAARRQAHYLRSITDDAGRRPAIGDDDGGQLFPVCGLAPDDCRDTLSTAAVLLDERALAVAPPPEPTFWMCGARALDAEPNSGATWPSVLHTASGYGISRTTRGDHLIFDAGALGYLNGGHAHADALSCTLTFAGRPLLIDPGTATYTMAPEVRDRFRSTMMHNTVVLDGRQQSSPRGPFHWASRADARPTTWQTADGCDYMEGTHDAYLPRRHTRAMLAIHTLGWCIVDHITGEGQVRIEQYWHLHPAWACALHSPRLCELRDGSVRLALASTSPLVLLPPGSHPLAEWSPAYGSVERAPTLCTEVKVSAPASVATFVPASAAIAEELSIDAVRVDAGPGPDWHGSAFRVSWRSGSAVILSAVERRPAADERAAPPQVWGAAGLHTDGRAAVLIDGPSGEWEAILVGGTILTSAGGPPVISSAEPLPLLRRTGARAASAVHEVEY